MDNFSKLLKMELGQQIPVKSVHKMRRDVVKRVYQFNPTDPFLYGCHMEQHKFWCNEESNTVLLKCHRDENDDIMFDIYQDVDSYQS